MYMGTKFQKRPALPRKQIVHVKYTSKTNGYKIVDII